MKTISKSIITGFLSVISILIILLIFCPADTHAENNTDSAASLLDVSISSTSGKSTASLTDGSYESAVSFNSDDSITVSSTQPMYGLYIIWGAPTDAWTLSYNTQTKQCGTNGFLHEYVEIPEGTTSCTIQLSKSESICDIYAYSAGKLPEDVQVWQPSCTTADILVFSTHADDELLFLGGVLATYGGQQNDRVQVVYMTNYWNNTKIREHEKLDGLWTSGIKDYPVNGEFDDLYATSLEGARTVYNQDSVTAFVTEQIRKFKPLVCVTQDINGEYGHGGHMLLASSVETAVDSSMDASFCPESANTYGTWDVPKTYLHLYPENKISLNLRVPLTNMGNQTAIDVASAAYKKHVSQQWCWFYVSDEYEYSCADFGLYRTTVGLDTTNDMLEHITTYEEQEEALRQKAEAESIAASKAASEAESSSIAASEADKRAADKKASFNSTLKIVLIIVVLVILVGALFFGIRYYIWKQNQKRRRKRRKRR